MAVSAGYREQVVGGTSYFSLDSGRVASHESAPRSFADIAVLYRSNAQSRVIEDSLRYRGIPYVIVNGTIVVDQGKVLQVKPGQPLQALELLGLILNHPAFPHGGVISLIVNKMRKLDPVGNSRL